MINQWARQEWRKVTCQFTKTDVRSIDSQATNYQIIAKLGLIHFSRMVCNDSSWLPVLIQIPCQLQP